MRIGTDAEIARHACGPRLARFGELWLEPVTPHNEWRRLEQLGLPAFATSPRSCAASYSSAKRRFAPASIHSNQLESRDNKHAPKGFQDHWRWPINAKSSAKYRPKLNCGGVNPEFRWQCPQDDEIAGQSCY